MLFTLAAVVYIYKLNVEKNRQRDIKHFTFNVMDNLPVGVIAFNQEGRLVFINKECQNLLGVLHTKVVGKTVEKVEETISYKGSIICSSLVRFVLETGKKVHNQRVCLVNNKGKKITCRIDVYPLLGHDVYSGVICILCDITTELNYYDLKRISDIVLRDMDSGVVAVNNRNEIILFNQAAEKITGLKAEEVIGKSYHDVMVNKSNRDCLLCEVVEKKQKIIKDEEVWYNINGREFCTLNTVEVLRDDNGSFLGVTCVFQDITELKKRHEVMIKQEKLAVVGQLAAGMAHEVRNPLTAVRGFAQLIAERCNNLDPKLIKMMISELDRTEAIISDFLGLAKPKDPEYRECDINKLIEKNLSIVNSKIMQHNITILKEYTENLPSIWVDENQITQVLLNIINNSIEAIQGKSKGSISIKTKYIDGNYVCIQICDDGSGMSKDQLNKLGTPFFTTKSDGTGLGLVISYEIIKRHHGYVEVESELNKGTCFKIYLPVNGEYFE
ncbi:MAG: PAS domain-containing protein [Desulfotomaculum sp.]|nr:PAS domain-containing protein [Desulfotomaculum sp.]